MGRDYYKEEWTTTKVLGALRDRREFALCIAGSGCVFRPPGYELRVRVAFSTAGVRVAGSGCVFDRWGAGCGFGCELRVRVAFSTAEVRVACVGTVAMNRACILRLVLRVDRFSVSHSTLYLHMRLFRRLELCMLRCVVGHSNFRMVFAGLVIFQSFFGPDEPPE
jgi:hypothetical protein